MSITTKAMISVLIMAQDFKQQGKIGELVNAAFVAGKSFGKRSPDESFGETVIDGNGSEHAALTNMAHFVRKAGQSKLRTLRNEFAAMEGVEVIDYPEAASPSTYEDYVNVLQTQSGDEITYRAVHVFGPTEVVVPRTKSLSRL